MQKHLPALRCMHMKWGVFLFKKYNKQMSQFFNRSKGDLDGYINVFQIETKCFASCTAFYAKVSIPLPLC